MALHDPTRHEPLLDRQWDPAVVLATLHELVEQADEAFDGRRGWPAHPTDDETTGHVHTSTYFGASGVLLALRRLAAAHGIETRLDLGAVSDTVWEAYRASPDAGWDAPSLYIGALGVLFVRACLGHADDVEILARIRSNVANPTREQLWGAPGSMLVAYHLARRAGDAAESQRWRAAYLESARQLTSELVVEPDGVQLWEQDLYGATVRYLGAAHGAAGNLFSLMLGQDWFEAAERSALFERAERMLVGRAEREGGLANWRPSLGEDKWLVQWCHGAPGMITSYRPFPVGISRAVEDLLLEAGELVWRAGPLEKGPSLCHGTAGNGYALLQLFERTQNQLWLDRARAFAMHTIEQIQRRRLRYGRAHFTLFTGDYGAACFLADCLTERAQFPLLELEIVHQTKSRARA